MPAPAMGVNAGYPSTYCPHCGRWISLHLIPDAPPPRSSDIRRWTTEQLEQEIVKDWPTNPPLEHFWHLLFEHDFAPPLLLHYTGYEAAKNIIRTTTVWASDAYELNDSQEVEYPCRLLREEIRRRQIYFLKRGERLFSDLCSALVEELVTPRDCYPAVFVFCLTENTMSERHWRQYASDKGYALGFRFSTPCTLGLFVPPRGKNPTAEGDAVLRRVVYEPNLQRQMLVDIVDTFLELFSETMVDRAGASANESLPSYLKKSFVENFKDFASRVLVSIKRPRYQREREWRVIVAPRPGFLEDDFRRPMNSIKKRHLAGNKRRHVALVPEKGALLPLCSMIAGRDCPAETRRSTSEQLRKGGYQFVLNDRVTRTTFP